MENKDLERQIYEYTINVYKRAKVHLDTFCDDMFEIFLHETTKSPIINPYSLYSLKILHLVDQELTKDIFFDQYYGFAPIKTTHPEGNDFIHNNEIHCLLSELPNKSDDYRINKQLCMRIRVLAGLNVWNHLIDCETLIFGDYETENYKEKFKTYVYNHPKYLRYSRLLKASLDSGRVMNKPEPLPTSMKEYIHFLKDPLVYVLLEPYNHMNFDSSENIILKTIVLNDGKLDII